MTLDLKTIVAVAALAMGALVTLLSFFLPEKTLFMTLAAMWGTTGVATLINYFFGSSHKATVPPADPPQ